MVLQPLRLLELDKLVVDDTQALLDDLILPKGLQRLVQALRQQPDAPPLDLLRAQFVQIAQVGEVASPLAD